MLIHSSYFFRVPPKRPEMLRLLALSEKLLLFKKLFLKFIFGGWGRTSLFYDFDIFVLFNRFSSYRWQSKKNSQSVHQVYRNACAYRKYKCANGCNKHSNTKHPSSTKSVGQPTSGDLCDDVSIEKWCQNGRLSRFGPVKLRMLKLFLKII